MTLLRAAIIVALLAIWEFLSHSRWLYCDVVPSLRAIAGALAELLLSGLYYFDLGATAGGIATALAIGGVSSLVVGIVLGGNPFLARAVEH